MNERAAALQALGAKAYRLGNFPRARQHFSKALDLFRTAGDNAAAMTALSDLGAACAAMQDWPAAADAHEAALAARRAALGETHEDVAASLQNLGAVRRAQGDAAAAEACHVQALAIWRMRFGPTHPVMAKALASLGALARDCGDAHAASNYAMQVLDIRRATLPPHDPALASAHDDAGLARALAGDAGAAERHWQAAIAILQSRSGTQAAMASLLQKIGVSQRRRGGLDSAAQTFTAALTADPALTSARHNLATTLTRLGRSGDAKHHRDIALSAQNLFVQAGPPRSPKALILSLADDGNIPLEHLLPEASFTRIWWFIGHGRTAAAALPAYDVVFNAIGDPDMSGQADAAVSAFLRHCTKPVLNDPARVRLTRRDLLPDALADIDGLATPRIVRLAPGATATDATREAANAGIELPVLLRPAGSHGGVGVLRVEDWATVSMPTGPAWYLSHFHDCFSPDGFTRKYRGIFVDRVFYPYHLAISPNWLAHYYTADMDAHGWKLAEELRFLTDPEASLGAGGYAALQEAGRRLDLDYCGIDFTLLQDGQILVFEANPTMLVHPEKPDGALAFKNTAVSRIITAVREMIGRE